MKNDILLSILIPVYNTEKLLPECLDSILEQDFGQNEYEIICVDDGSPDNAGLVLDEYALLHKNIKVIHKENGGLASARYVGYQNAQGVYVWFVDSDDFVNEDSLVTIKREIVKNNYPDRVNFKYFRLPWDGKTKRKEILADKNSLMTIAGETAIWNSIFKKQFLDITHIPDRYIKENVSFAEDVLFLFLSKAFETTTAKVPDPIVFYRDNPESMTKQKSLKIEMKRASDYIQVVTVMKDVLANYNVYGCKGDKDLLSYLFLNQIWILMELIACLPLMYSLKCLFTAKAVKVFPVSFPVSLSGLF